MDDFEFDDFVDFDDFPVKHVEEDSLNKDPYFKMCKVEFDDSTTDYYKSMRERKLNIFTQEDDIDTEKCFPYSYVWDIFTGEKIGLDPYGPLWFHPVELVNYFEKKCLTNLWHDQVDENGGIYQGYYGDLVGSGNEMYVKGRGYYTELYLFRIPIIDCYVPKGTNMSLITMGGKLETEDLQLIDELMQKYHTKLYLKKYKKNPPSLLEMKKHYDIALSSEPSLEQFGILKNQETSITEELLRNYRYQINISGVNNLKNLVGKNI